MKRASSYINSHIRKGKGRTYDAHYRDMPHRRFLWEREKKVLESIVSDYFVGKEISLLDFACGTGRISAFLESRVDAAVGLDVSWDMLKEALKKLKRTRLIQADIVSGNVLEGQSFNLITAFRFFLNAEPELREAAMEALVPLLDDDGWLVFNNHRNITSPMLKYKYRRSGAELNFMTLWEMHDLAERHGLEILRIYPVGFFPFFKNRVPKSVKHAIDGVASRLSFIRSWSENPVALCRHASAGKG
jgi:SAM-dependent methyltransferase